MTKSQHTPTPWEHIPLENSQGIYAEAKRRDLYRDRIAELPQWGNADEVKANAALIVKAVNCHDSLVRAASRLIIGKDPSHPDWYEGMEADAEVELSAALAKAEAT